MARGKSASVSVLNELHEAIARYMLRRIQSSEPDPNAEMEIDEETGEVVASKVAVSTTTTPKVTFKSK